MTSKLVYRVLVIVVLGTRVLAQDQGRPRTLPKLQKNPIQFTFLWLDEGRWEGKDYKVDMREQEATAHRSVDHRRRKKAQGRCPATVG